MQSQYDQLLTQLGKTQGRIRELGLQNIRAKLSSNPDLRRIYDEVLEEMRKTHRNLIKIDDLLMEMFDFLED